MRTRSTWRTPKSVSICESGSAFPRARFGFSSHVDALRCSPRMSRAAATTRASRTRRSVSSTLRRACTLRRARVRFGIECEAESSRPKGRVDQALPSRHSTAGRSAQFRSGPAHSRRFAQANVRLPKPVEFAMPGSAWPSCNQQFAKWHSRSGFSLFSGGVYRCTQLLMRGDA